jgi:FKBP-type peptidyl-prolyl cis-trans isomerase SlyD
LSRDKKALLPLTCVEFRAAYPVAEDKLTVTDDLVVSLDYTLRLDDGEIIDSSADREPLEFLQGQGQIIPGLEQALYGMAVDDQKDVEVAPADGYGERDADAVELVDRDVFPPDLDIKPGIGLRMRDGSGQAMDAYVADVRPDGVLLDFNHPLAGETLFFQVKIAALRAATGDELAHGHIHDSEDGH